MQKLAFYILYSQTYTDHDLVTAWLMARDYSHGIFEQLFYYGQAYNIALDAWLASPLVRLGMDPVFAPGIVCLLLSCAAPLLLWFYCHKQQNYTVAIGYIAIHLLAPFTFVYQYASGLAMAIHICTILILVYLWKPNPFCLFLCLGVALFLALGVKNTLALFAWFAVLSFPINKEEKTWNWRSAWLGGILLGAVSYLLFIAKNTSRNTLTHASRLGDIGFEFFWKSLQHFADLFWGLGPVWSGLGVLYFIGILIFCIYFFWKRKYTLAIANMAFIVVTLATLFAEKSLDGELHAYFPFVRFFMGTIPVLGLNAIFLTEIRFPRAISATALVLSMVGVSLFFIRFNAEREYHKNANKVTGITPVRTIVNMTRRPELKQLWQSGKICVSLDHACLMYAAPAIFPEARTLFLPYDRRPKKYADFYYSELREMYVINEKIPLTDTTVLGYKITRILSRELFVYHISGRGMQAGEWMQQSGWQFQRILD